MALKKIIDMKQEEITYDNLKKRLETYPRWYRLWLDIIASSWYQFLLSMFLLFPPCLAYMILFTRYWFVVLLCYCWVYYDRETPHTGGRKIKFPRGWIADWMRDYFPIAMIKTAELPATKNYIFCSYPHGIACVGSTVNFVQEPTIFQKMFPHLDLYATTLTPSFYIPILRDLMLWTGTTSVSERGIWNLLNNRPNSGVVCKLIAGGAAETLYSDFDEYRIILKNRKGFVKIALKTGASLVPVFNFGENELFDQLRGERWGKFQEKTYKLTGYTPVVPFGRKIGFTSFYPRVSPVITVVGQPINVPKIENPSKEQIEKYHSIFKEELSNLFEKYKGRCDPRGQKARLSYI